MHKVSSVLHTREHTCPWTHMYKGTHVDMHVNNRVHAAFAKSGATTWRYKIKTQKILMCSNTLKFKICLFKKKVHFIKFSNNVEQGKVFLSLIISISNHLTSNFYAGLLYITKENYWILFNKERTKLSVLINIQYDTQTQRSKKHKLDITA